MTDRVPRMPAAFPPFDGSAPKKQQFPADGPEMGIDPEKRYTAHMSTSGLHHHFKALTGMSPLQYQKQLRLAEARRLMLAERLDAATAAFRVGYESPSQFSRE